MKTKKEIKRMAYYKVDGENRNLVEEDWDFLIILDACRFDFFKELYMKKYKHIGGNLKKAISPVTFTTDWLDKNFKGFYDDIVYISANPYINSKVKGVASHGFEFDAKKHFFKVIDVWDWGWDFLLFLPHSFVIYKYINNRFFRWRIETGFSKRLFKIFLSSL